MSLLGPCDKAIIWGNEARLDTILPSRKILAKKAYYEVFLALPTAPFDASPLDCLLFFMVSQKLLLVLVYNLIIFNIIAISRSVSCSFSVAVLLRFDHPRSSLLRLNVFRPPICHVHCLPLPKLRNPLNCARRMRLRFSTGHPYVLSSCPLFSTKHPWYPLILQLPSGLEHCCMVLHCEVSDHADLGVSVSCIYTTDHTSTNFLFTPH